MDGEPRRCALYLRVSDNRSTVENQRAQLAEWAESRGWRIVAEHTDEGVSGWVRGSADERDGLRDLILGAHRGEYSLCLIWALDRLTREGPEVAFRTLRRLREAGAELVSYQEPSLSLKGIAGDVTIAVAASFAEAYSERLSHRVRAGMARAGAKGIHLGRERNLIDETELSQLKSEGLSIRKIAERTGVPRTTVARRLAEIENRRGVVE